MFYYLKYIWVKVFKNGSSKICGRQPSKKLKGCLPQSLLGPLLNTLTHLIFRLLKKSFLASLTKFTLTFVCMLAYFSVFFTTKFVKAWLLLYPKKVDFICFNEHPLKRWKMLFIPSQKLFSLDRYLNFCSDSFGHVGKWLDKKAKVNFKTYDVITGKQTITIHILPNISRSKGNHAKKFGQLVEYNVRNIFLQKSSQKWGRETRLFLIMPFFYVTKKVRTII